MYNLSSLLVRLWHHISSRRRKHIYFLLVMMLFASVAEIVSIGAVIPFLGVLTDPDTVYSNQKLLPLINFLGIKSHHELILPLTLIFIVAAVLSGFMRLLLLWVTTRLSFSTGHELSLDIFRRTLYQPYAVHLNRNSSEVINGVTAKANGVILHILLPLLTIISNIVIMFAIMLVLVAIDPFIAILSMLGFGVIYVVIALLTKKRLVGNSQRIADESTRVIKSIQEGLGGIRDILIDGTQAKYSKAYRSADLRLRNSQCNNHFISQSPRFGLESLGMVLIAILAYYLASREEGLGNAIPVLGAMALGAQRLLPLLQRIYLGWSTIQGGIASLSDALDLLDQSQEIEVHDLKCPDIEFKNKIVFKDISFRYSDSAPWVLRGLSFDIVKGSRVGLIGSTGSGKTTLLDIVMGLLHSSEGVFKVDDRVVSKENLWAWQSHIAHVPQHIYLADTTVEENIALGVLENEIDRERVKRAARQAQIDDLIESLPEKYNTYVGERGVRLSGGQLQRIGIARALYKQADVVIFDEATSALDQDTEQAVMNEIDKLSPDLTIIIIAHRLTTLKNCSKIIELNSNNKFRVGNYDEIVQNGDVLTKNVSD